MVVFGLILEHIKDWALLIVVVPNILLKRVKDTVFISNWVLLRALLREFQQILHIKFESGK
jgi:hypothetical protein